MSEYSYAGAAHPNMIVQYEWILENVDKDPKTFVSKMILFRGEKVFRVGLKNYMERPILFVIAIDLSKIGMRVDGVTYGIQDSGIGPTTMAKVVNINSYQNEGSLQLFTTELAEKINGNCTFVFRICVEGSYGSGYSYRLCDRLAKDQLWAAAKNQNSTDVEFVVKDKTFSAHKAILAARSPVFAAEFTKEQPVRDGPHQIHIDGVEPSTVEQFLHFIYTGESKGTLANEELLKLAEQYQLSTLSRLCELALNQITHRQMANLVINLDKETATLSSAIRPDKDTEIFFDLTTPTFRCCSYSFDLSAEKISKYAVQYQNEDFFFVYVTVNSSNLHKPLVHCLCAKDRNFGLKVDDIYLRDNRSQGNEWYKMESKDSQKNAELLHFTAQPKCDRRTNFQLDIKMVSTIGNYYYEMMDEDWMNDFWTAATEQKLTDVEIFVGTVKLMEAHRVILSARSPVMNETINKIGDIGKSVCTFDAEFDVDTVKHFLKFLYTGSLETSGISNSNKNHQQLFKLATTYEVETLKNICQFADVAEPNVEELTNSLLGL